SEWAKKRCYIYKYDGLGRMTERRWPGKGKELFVSDPAGNVAATQDSLLRQSGRWHITRYDRSNRPVETMLTQQSITEAQMRSYFSYETAQTFYSQNGNIPFTSSVYELTDNISLTKTEIGKTDISFTINQSTVLSFKPEDQTVSQTDVDTTKFASVLWERTAMTMSKEGTLIGVAEDGSSNPGTIAQSDILYRYTAYFYDCYARPIQTVTLYPDGTISTASTKYNYTALPLRQTVRLKVPQGTTSTDTLNVVLTELFTYDKRGRMLSSNATMQTFNSFLQSGVLTYSDTLSSVASATYSYDELGHLTGKALGGNLSQTIAYNIQDWMTTMQTKKGTENIFSQALKYFNPVKPSTTALYSGNISEWETIQGTNTASTYGFSYDTQGRLTNSNRFDGTTTTLSQLYTERDISYDLNGNIQTLKRIAENASSPMHHFSYTYNGDKLSELTRWQGGVATSTFYSYDGNGNMTLDGDQQIKLSYDINNLVHKVKKMNGPGLQDELTATYSYFADGTKFSISDTDGNSRIYIGPFTLARKEYQNAKITLLESADILGADARFAFAATPQITSGTDTTYTVACETLYLLKDHLGSIRVITDSQGNTLERNDYYPYGLQTDLGRSYTSLGDKYRVRIPTSFTSNNPNISNLAVTSPSFEILPYRMLYNGKELQMIAQSRLIDYGARQYDPTIARWIIIDPMSESFFNLSSFIFCSNSPIIRKDNNGTVDSPIYNTEGEFLGTDDCGIKGQAIVMEEKDFKQGMSHTEALSKDKGATGLVSDTAREKLNKHYKNLPNRPDYDGIITRQEGITWAKQHPNAKKFPTPDNTLYADASKLNFGLLSISEFKKKVQPLNLFPTDLSVLSMLKIKMALKDENVFNTTYALGRFNASVSNYSKKTITIINDSATVYDWNKRGGFVRDLLIRTERYLNGLTDNHGFNVYYYGEGILNF
ncbi:MAG: hypothetical protein IKZ50_05285, partial [Bacteroidales bacterium]|nr:hypothetical protein [Bacteroidales bacterium]